MDFLERQSMKFSKLPTFQDSSQLWIYCAHEILIPYQLIYPNPYMNLITANPLHEHNNFQTEFYVFAYV